MTLRHPLLIPRKKGGADPHRHSCKIHIYPNQGPRAAPIDPPRVPPRPRPGHYSESIQPSPEPALLGARGATQCPD